MTFSDSGFAIVFAEATKKWNDTIHPTRMSSSSSRPGIILTSHIEDQWDQLCPKYNDTLQEAL